jgi:gamma-glutamyl-gamma-aminobutyraldehyde dehydrogenase
MSIKTAQAQDRAGWQRLATRARSGLETRLFIDGEYVDAVDGGRFATVNPADGEVVAEMAAGTSKDVDRAVAAARRAFKSGAWSKLAPRARMAVLYRFAELIDEHAEELAVLETLDMGKPIADVVNVDLPAVCDTLRYFAECIDKVEGAVTSTPSNIMHFVLREPLGVVGAITPWNYPLLMATVEDRAGARGREHGRAEAGRAGAHELPAARALFVEAGGPPGVFNVVNGDGEVAGQALARHMDVAKVSFTGSTEVGKLMLQYAGLSNMKRVALECGGKSPQVFMGDLSDMERAVIAAYSGIYANMGEVCNAGSRLLVERSIYDEFTERFVDSGREAFKPGDPLDPTTNMGPLVTKEAQTRVLRYIDIGKKEGAKLRFGGAVPAGPRARRLRAADALHGREQPHADRARGDLRDRCRDDPLRRRRGGDRDRERHDLRTRSRRWTRDLERAMQLIKGIEAGVIWVNCFDEGDMTQPFGGYKQSGNARDKCFESLLEYTQMKSAWIRLPA